MPPFVGVAVKVTVAPAQIVVELAAAVTAGVTLEVTAIVIGADVAVFVVVQVAVEVITTSNTSPLEIEVLAYVAAVAPEITVEFLRH